MDWPILRGLTESDRKQVLDATRRRRFGRNEVVCHEGDLADSLHLLDRGRVLVRVTTPLGDSATLAVLSAGDVFGEMALIFPDQRRTATIVAIEQTETLSLNQDAFERLRGEHPSVDRLLTEVLAKTVRDLSERMLEALYVPADTRVVRRLLDLARIYGGGEPGTVITLTQDDLAGLAGTTRPTVNRVLKQEEARGLVALSRGKTEIVDPEGLRARARYR